jgi:hypothetical protein
MTVAKIALMFVIFVGILAMTISIMRDSQQRAITAAVPPPPVVSEPLNRVIPPDDDNEYISHRYASDIFAGMFSDQSAWVINNENFDRIKAGQMNKFFVSQ